MSPHVSQDEIVAARRWFAEELRHIARVRSPAVVQAFASVAREHFAGPGPWRLLVPGICRSIGQRRTPTRVISATTC